jgi:hypothetical protein
VGISGKFLQHGDEITWGEKIEHQDSGIEASSAGSLCAHSRASSAHVLSSRRRHGRWASKTTAFRCFQRFQQQSMRKTARWRCGISGGRGMFQSSSTEAEKTEYTSN